MRGLPTLGELQLSDLWGIFRIRASAVARRLSPDLANVRGENGQQEKGLSFEGPFVCR